MARTAPAPNIPPIPGMCPSIAVMGGGGDGGGGSGAGGAGGDGSGPADGDGSGEAAEGDGNGAGSCGNGSNGDCTNCGNQTSAGDPVDIGTGRVYTVPVYDLTLPGPLPFSFRRKYSSHSRKRDVGLGPGWVYSLAWEVVVRRSRVDLWDGDGTRTEFPIIDQGAQVSGRKQQRLRRDAEGYVLTDDSFERYFKAAPNDATRFRLAHIRDRNGNTIKLEYTANGALARMVDCVGRTIVVSNDAQGHITSLAVHNALSQGQLIFVARYTYDDAGRLARVTDAQNYASDYGYDDRNRLSWHKLAGRPTFHFVYDMADRCVETWGAFPDKPMPGLAPDDGLLADKRTVAKGILHVKIDYADGGYVELIDSVRVRRFFVDGSGKITKGVAGGGVTTRKFDDNGRLLIHEDALQQATHFQWDAEGRLTRVTNPLGEFEEIVRDRQGRPVEHRDGLGKLVLFGYDARGNVEFIEASLGDRATFRYNDQGMPVEQTRPDGGVIRIAYDAQQNPIRVQNPDGTEFKWAYDYRGRPVSKTDQLGNSTRYEYDERGLVVAIHEPNGGIVRFTHDAARDCIAVSDPLGTQRVEYNGAHKVTKTIHADGTFAEFLYNREGFLVEIRNEKGESQAYAHDHMGLVRSVVGYDGATQHYDFDAMGRLVSYKNQLGQITKYERDSVGRVLSVEYDDGTAAKLQYDIRGNVIKAESSAAKLAYQLDPAGQILKEVQDVGGVAHTVERGYDIMRLRSLMRTSLGHDETITRDNFGRIRERSIDPRHTFAFDYDARGQALSIGLPGGAKLVNQWDPVGALTRRSVVAGGAAQDHEVQWTGFQLPGATVDKTFNYTLNAMILSRNDIDFGAQEYAYDPNSRVTERRVRGAPTEAFAYDASHNPYEQSTGRSYGPGDRLLRKDNVDYAWDRAGRLVERVVHTDQGAQKTAYEWSAAGLLSRVRRHDGMVVEFSYDAFARRMNKRVLSPGPGARLEERASTRYVWVGPQLVHEIRKSAAAAGDPIVEERTYVYDDRSQPLAHKVKRSDAPEVDTWVYYVNDPIGTPEHLVDGAGKIVGTLERTTWGKVTSKGADTPFRFRGQYEDEETGLYYNRYRYYDPDTGRYISEDPAGGQPDLNLYRYCTNPVDGVDPLGLQHQANFSFTPGNGTAGTMSGTRDSTFCDDTRDAMIDPNLTRPNANGTPHPYAPDECLSAFNRERFSDTEAKVIRDVNANTTQAQRDGSTLIINGTRPPCSRCRGRMEQFAQENNANVEYNWSGGVNNDGTPIPPGRMQSDFRVATGAPGTTIVGMRAGTNANWRP